MIALFRKGIAQQVSGKLKAVTSLDTWAKEPAALNVLDPLHDQGK